MATNTTSSEYRDRVQQRALSEVATKLVSSNPPGALAECCRVLNTLLGNLAREDCAKYRRVNLQNAKIKEAVLSARYAEELLLACGFESAEDGAVEMRREDGSAAATAGQEALDAACAQYLGPLWLQHRLPAEGVRSCCHAGDELVATGTMDNALRVWSASPPIQGDAQPLSTLRAHEGMRGVNGVLALLYTPLGEVVSCARDGKLLVWDLSTGGSPLQVASHPTSPGAGIRGRPHVPPCPAPPPQCSHPARHVLSGIEWPRR